MHKFQVKRKNTKCYSHCKTETNNFDNLTNWKDKKILLLLL